MESLNSPQSYEPCACTTHFKLDYRSSKSFLQNVFTTILLPDLNSTTKGFSNLVEIAAGKFLLKMIGILKNVHIQVELNPLSPEKSISTRKKYYYFE